MAWRQIIALGLPLFIKHSNRKHSRLKKNIVICSILWFILNQIYYRDGIFPISPSPNVFAWKQSKMQKRLWTAAHLGDWAFPYCKSEFIQWGWCVEPLNTRPKLLLVLQFIQSVPTVTHNKLFSPQFHLLDHSKFIHGHFFLDVTQNVIAIYLTHVLSLLKERPFVTQPTNPLINQQHRTCYTNHKMIIS